MYKDWIVSILFQLKLTEHLNQVKLNSKEKDILAAISKAQEEQGDEEELKPQKLDVFLQYYDDLPACDSDCEKLKGVFSRYGFNKPDHIYDLKNPTFKDIQKVRMQIMKHINADPKQKVAVFYVLAGHGMQEGGKQNMVLNEYDETTGFYKFWAVEAIIRTFAALYSNTYQVGYFACCREIFKPTTHFNCFSSDLKGEQFSDAFQKQIKSEALLKQVQASQELYAKQKSKIIITVMHSLWQMKFNHT